MKYRDEHSNRKRISTKVVVIRNFVLITTIFTTLILFLISFFVFFIFKNQFNIIQSMSSIFVSAEASEELNLTPPVAFTEEELEELGGNAQEFVENNTSNRGQVFNSTNKPSGSKDYKAVKINNYPSYGTRYGEFSISSLGIKLPLYFGDSLAILKKGGIGHNSGSYFPGEGGSIITCGHNTARILKKISNINIGDIATITTDYGTFEYKAYATKIIKETDLQELPIQKDLEILMIYTCYPFNSIGHVENRFIVYFERIK